MPDYMQYFLMRPADVIDYIKQKSDFFSLESILHCKEIGDGNVNYVFRVVDEQAGKSIIIKQAGEATRISEKIKLSTDRGRIEAQILELQQQYAPGLVPAVYWYDEVMCVIAMQDMTGHSMMRTALLQHHTFPHFAEQITTFMANTLFFTSDLGMPPKVKKALVKQFMNPDLCEISENLVYTEPYGDHQSRNHVFAPNADFVKTELYEDAALLTEVGKLKVAFENNAQALIHGDLHTGSIFINQTHLFVFDPEFAFVGPIGYDIGNVVANLGFVLLHALLVMEPASKKKAFTDWVKSAMVDTVDLFIKKFRHLCVTHIADPMKQSPEFIDWYITQVLVDTAGVCGLETIRRMVGMANVVDITNIADQTKRAYAERVLIMYGKHCIMHRTEFENGRSFVALLEHFLEIVE